ncbi:uncharacterized protein [Paramisgurnus dabryanus]|uniref:uncharacterized protein n=1 Tax=Paramisgurnus dabryanus TaxID=90735 RepID=UPI0031F43193
MLEKMQTCRVLLRVFVTLLMCDFGMFFTSSSLLPSESPPQDHTFNIFTPSVNITTTKLTTPRTERTTGLKTTNDNTTELNTADNTTIDLYVTKNKAFPYSNATSSTTKPMGKTNTIKDSSDSAGYTLAVIFLIIIVILIILLLGILYFLRKKGRSYSFDLTHTSANEHVEPFMDLDQQGVSYEHKDKDLSVSLDFTQDDKSNEKSSPIANGCTGEKTEQTTDSGNEEQNLPEENSFPSSPSLTPPMKKVEFNLDLDDFMSGESDVISPISEDSCDAAHNENNNNISDSGWGTAGEIFTEINLDEPKEQP